MSDITKLTTELRNERTSDIDKLSTLEMVRLINREDQSAIDAVSRVDEVISKAIDVAYEAISSGVYLSTE